VLVLLIGVCTASQVSHRRTAEERKRVGGSFIAELEAGTRREPPDPFTLQTHADGGYTLYFAEPAFFLPTDFFYVWDRGEKRWELREAGELTQN
jgi:hypothetical protein